MNLPKPLDTFRLEKRAGEYKDFQLSPDDPYPLKGVTYPTNYGDIEGYTGEDDAPLDVFLGSGDLLGYIVVERPDTKQGEHKFCVNLTEDEESAIHREFKSVLTDHGRFNSFEQFLLAIEPFKDAID